MGRNRMVLEHMREHGSITGAEAWKNFHLYRLSSVIYRLRNEGHEIDTLMVEDESGVKYAKYILTKDKERS